MNFKKENLIACQPEKIILSPGPGHPKDNNACFDILNSFKEKTPILGICLGHQIIADYFGAGIKTARKIMHGKGSQVFHKNSHIFKNISNPFFAIRYNSLLVDSTKIPRDLDVISWTKDDHSFEVMAVKHKNYSIFGIQFHPESILTKEGLKILENFLRIS